MKNIKQLESGDGVLWTDGRPKIIKAIRKEGGERFFLFYELSCEYSEMQLSEILNHRIRASFTTIEEAVKVLRLDKRVDWFTYQGILVKKAKGDKMGHQYPEPFIINGNYVYIYEQK